MNIILLSGGSGKRLWPLTNGYRAKQFIRCLRDNNGGLESMLQRVYRQIRKAYPDAQVMVAANMIQEKIIREQLGEDVSLSLEPCSRDTFAAIALACAGLADEGKVHPEEPVLVCTTDFYAEESYFVLFEKMMESIRKDLCDIALIGKKPDTEAATEYGYIVPEEAIYLDKVDSDLLKNNEAVKESLRVVYFTEKPDEKGADRLTKLGALWNCGVFGFKIGYILNMAEIHLGASDKEGLLSVYNELPRISFDCAVAADAKNMQVFPYSGEWCDIGGWDTFMSVMDKPVHGEVITSDDSKNVNVLNELGIPIVVAGVDDIIVSVTNEGILISSRKECANIKKYIEGYF